MYEQFHALGDVDITKEPMEVGPTIHYTMGGVRAEPETCATNVPGLYVAGEVACGVHGANRLGGNALCDLLVFGKRAGEAATKYARSASHGTIDAAQIREEAEILLAPFESIGTENPYLLTQELQAAMQEAFDVSRARAPGLADDFVQQQMKMLDSLPAEMRSSMLNDLAAGNRLEAPWLSGAVARMAKEAGIAAPVSATIYAALKPYVDGAAH